MLIQHNPLLLS